LPSVFHAGSADDVLLRSDEPEMETSPHGVQLFLLVMLIKWRFSGESLGSLLPHPRCGKVFF